MAKTPTWFESDRIPDGIWSRSLCKLNEQEFVFAYNKDHCHGLYKYSVHLRQYNKLIDYSNPMETAYCLRFDPGNSMLYCVGFHGPLFIIDMKREKCIKWKETDCFCGKLLNIHGQIHLIGGWETHKHLKWNHETQEFAELYNFGEDLGYCQTLSAVHIPRKGEILMIVYNLKEIIIWKTSVGTIQWKEILTLPFDGHSCASVSLTSDENYVIMSDSATDHIYALDISQDKYELHVSSIPTPWKGLHAMIVAGGFQDEIFVFGWIRQLFSLPEFEYIQEPPNYLKRQIVMWYNQEQIHWICQFSKRHFVIKLKYVLSSLLN